MVTLLILVTFLILVSLPILATFLILVFFIGATGDTTSNRTPLMTGDNVVLPETTGKPVNTLNKSVITYGSVSAVHYQIEDCAASLHQGVGNSGIALIDDHQGPQIRRGTQISTVGNTIEILIDLNEHAEGEVFRCFWWHHAGGNKTIYKICRQLDMRVGQTGIQPELHDANELFRETGRV